MAEVASAYVTLIPSARGFASGVTKQTDAAAKSSGRRFGSIFSGSLKSVIGGALAGVGVTKLLSDSIGEAREAQKVGALTAQVIKSTGGAANVTAKQVGDLATSISNKVGVDDEAIQSGENMLLTFKNIRNEAGRGNDIFNQAAKTTTDLAAAMAAASGGELNFRSASIQMGKALNDPVKGITALSRVGVTFTDQQKNQIKALVASGDTMKAQKIILKELKSEFGGAAEAQATAGDKAKVAWKNLEEQVGTALLPVIDNLANRLTKDVIPAVSKFVTQMQDGTGAGGEFVDDLKQIVDVGKSVLGFFNGLPGPVKKYGAELLIASVAIGKMNSALGGISGGISKYTTAISTAEGRQAKMVAGLQGLGGALRNVAGAGGMVLLADSADEAGTKVGALKGIAGGALSGAALGAFAGPPGAAIGAALGGLAGAAFLMGKDIRSAGKATADTLPTMTQYAQTLSGAAAATTKLTREMVFERIQKSGLLKQTEALGISDRDAVQAALGNAAARKRVSAALADAVAHGKNYAALNIANKLGAETTAINSSRVAQLQKNLALAKTDKQAEKIQAKLDKLGRTNANPRIALSNDEPTRRKLTVIDGYVHDLTGAHPNIRVDADTSRALSKIQSLLNRQWSTVVNIIPFVSSPKHRATGGPVMAGQPYIVGERRPELFVPNQSGRIIPKVPSTVAAPTGVESEQTYFRAFSRALSASGAIVIRKPDLEALDLLVGTA